ncbi:hypothetical protein D9M71_590190 [compost metagenome]
MLQALFGASLQLFLAGGGRALEHQVGPEKFGGSHQHCTIEAGAEIADGGTGGDCHQQGEEQYAQFAGASVAQQLTQGKAQHVQQRQPCHQASWGVTRCPASRRIRRRQRCARRSSWVTSTRVVPRS